MSAPAHTGSCLCGGIRFEIDAPLAPVQVCHCGQCRRAQGTPFATNIPVPRAAFRLHDPQALLRGWASSPGKQRMFCGRCGAPLYSARADRPDLVRVRAGLIDGPLGVAPAAHFHVASKADWWSIGDSLPQHEGGPGETPAPP